MTFGVSGWGQGRGCESWRRGHQETESLGYWKDQIYGYWSRQMRWRSGSEPGAKIFKELGEWLGNDLQSPITHWNSDWQRLMTWHSKMKIYSLGCCSCGGKEAIWNNKDTSPPSPPPPPQAWHCNNLARHNSHHFRGLGEKQVASWRESQLI